MSILKILDKNNKEIVFSYMTKGITTLWWIFFLIFIPKLYSVENFWQLTLLISYISLMGIFFGATVQEWVKKEIVENRHDISHSKLIANICNWFYIKLIFNIIFLLLLYMLANVLNLEVIKQNFWLFYILTFFMNLRGLITNIFVSLHKNKNFLVISFLEYFFKILFLLIFYFLWQTSLSNILLSFVIGYWISTLRWFYRLFIWYKIKLLKPDKKIIKNLFKRYFLLSLSNISFLVIANIDNILVSHFFDKTTLWHYTIATQIINNMWIFTISIITWIIPLFNLKESGEKLKILFKKYYKILVLINLSLSVLIFLLSPFVIKIIYWDWYELSITILRLLSILPILSTSQVFFTNILTNYGEYKNQMKIWIFISILNIILTYVFIQKLSIIWVCISNLLSYFIWDLFLFFIFYKRTFSFKTN